jgi:hypothetical protein
VPLFFGIGAGLVVLIRWLEGWHPIWNGSVITTVELTTVPLGFLAGIGGFDYWVRYAIGQPTPSPRTTRATARRAGATTSESTPTTR